MTQPSVQADLRLPDGYTSRPARLEDAEAVSILWTTISHHLGDTQKQFDPELARSEWQEPGFDLTTSTQIVWDAAGKLVAFAALWDTHPTPVTPWLSLSILPDHYDTGLPESLLSWAESRARQAIDRCPPDARVALRTSAKVEYTRRRQVLEAGGFKAIRYFFRMLINMTEAPPEPTLPDGFSIRTYRHPDELDALIKADEDGFRDHWGFIDYPFDELKKEWEHWLSTDKLFDPALFFLAIDDATGDIAGISLCRAEQYSDPTVAYIDSLAVIPRYRRKGIALALLHHTFGEFWRRGRADVALHVDGSSLTNAVALYKRAGMREDERSVNYEKELRPGVVLETVEVSNQ